MSSPREQLEAVVAKWRSEIRDYPYTEQGIAARCAVKLCADELVAILASWQEPVQEQGTCEWCDGHAIMCAECITKMKSEQYKAILTTAEAMNKTPADILNQVVSERFGTPAPTADVPQAPCSRSLYWRDLAEAIQQEKQE